MIDRPPSYSPLAGLSRKFMLWIALPAGIVIGLVLAIGSIKTPVERYAAETMDMLARNPGIAAGRARAEQARLEAARNAGRK